MDWDKVFLWLLGIALVGLLIGGWKSRALRSTAETPDAKVEASNVPADNNDAEGRAYLMANTSPWAFAPPVNNYLPAMVAGGSAVIVPPAGQGKYGCFEC